MDNTTKLAQVLKEARGKSPYSPMFGTIISLPELKIQIGSKILLDDSQVKSIFDIAEYTTHNDGHIEYIHLNKEVVLLPYSDDQKFIAVGVVV